MNYQTIVDDLRRKAEELNTAADTIESVYLSGGDSVVSQPSPQRWAPGQGRAPESQLPAVESQLPSVEVSQVVMEQPEPVARPSRRKPAAPAAVKAPARRPVAAPAAIAAVEDGAVAEFNEQEYGRVVKGVREMLKMGVRREVLKPTVVNWCAAMSIQADDEMVERAMKDAQAA